MFGPSQVSVDNGLTLTASRNTGSYASLFPWISGVVTTEGKFSLPSTGWYVQVLAKMPDQSQGMWPAIWFLPGVSGTPYNELDGYEGGWIGADPNETMHSDYFSAEGQQQNAYSVGADVAAGYHVYGFHFVPGQSITVVLRRAAGVGGLGVERRHHHPGALRDHHRASRWRRRRRRTTPCRSRPPLRPQWKSQRCRRTRSAPTARPQRREQHPTSASDRFNRVG